MPTNTTIRTVSFPTEGLLRSLQPLPGGIRGVLWNLVEPPADIGADRIDAVVLPYANWQDWAGPLSVATGLKLVQTQTTGYDGVIEAVGPEVGVANAAGVHAAATAEHAVALVLASLRGIDVAARDQPAGAWNSRRYPGLADRKVLLVGVGGIGTEIARRLEPFDVELTRVGRTARTDDAGHVHGADELTRLAGSAEVMIVITPLTGATRHLIDAAVLAALPDGALVVNVARGPVVDSDALTAEVVSGRLRAALDVFDPEPIPADHPLWTAPGALITPHVGGNTEAFRPRIVSLLRSQLEILAKGERPLNLVQSGAFGD